MELLTFLRVLYQRKWLILAVVGSSLVLTYFITRNLPDTFLATTQVATGTQNMVMGADNESPDEMLQYFDMGPKFANLSEMIREDIVVQMLAFRLALNDLESQEPFFDLEQVKNTYSSSDLLEARNFLRNKLDNTEPLIPGEDDERWIQLLEEMSYEVAELKDQIEVELDPATDYLNISFRSEDRFFAAFAVNSLTEEFIRYYQAVDKQKMDNSIEFLSRLSEQKKEELDRYTDNYLDAKVSPDDRRSIELKNWIVEQNEYHLVRESERRKLGILNRLREDIDQRLGESEKAYLLKQSSKNEQEVLRLQDQLNDLSEKRIQALIGRKSLEGIEGSIESYRNRLGAILVGVDEAELAAMGPRAKDRVYYRVDVQLRLEESKNCLLYLEKALGGEDQRNRWHSYSQGMMEDIQEARDAYIEVVNKLNQAHIASLNPLSPVMRVAAAQAPHSAEPKQHGLLVTLSGVSSFAICVFLLFLLEYMDISVRNRQILERVTRIQTIGALNNINDTQLDLPVIFSKAFPDKHIESFKQQVRKLRFEIMASSGRVIMFTSTQPKVGKSTILLALAYSLSLSKKKVLIIDTNLKNGDLSTVCQAESRLQKYVEGHPPTKRLVQSTGLANIDIIGCEPVAMSPSEYFQNVSLNNLIDKVKEGYDYIFLEGPAMNMFSDSKEIVELADKIIPVFSAKNTLKQVDRDNVNYLKQLKDKLLGSVLNQMDVKELS